MEQYYNIKEKTNTESYGIVVRVKEGKLEEITGDKNTLKEYGVSLDNKGNLNVGKKYFYSEISKNKAYKLKGIEKEWRMTQLYFAEEGSPHLIGKNSEALY